MGVKKDYLKFFEGLSEEGFLRLLGRMATSFRLPAKVDAMWIPGRSYGDMKYVVKWAAHLYMQGKANYILLPFTKGATSKQPDIPRQSARTTDDMINLLVSMNVPIERICTTNPDVLVYNTGDESQQMVLAAKQAEWNSVITVTGATQPERNVLTNMQARSKEGLDWGQLKIYPATPKYIAWSKGIQAAQGDERAMHVLDVVEEDKRVFDYGPKPNGKGFLFYPSQGVEYLLWLDDNTDHPSLHDIWE